MVWTTVLWCPQLVDVQDLVLPLNDYKQSIALGIYIFIIFKTKKYASLQYFDTCFMHNIGVVSDKK